MAYWHNDDGTPAPWGTGRFDPSHLMPLVVVILLGLLLWWGK